ncbi:hypothetical protein J437_LFUL019291 [Ladona fulva]|uniref:CCHC-type domain-containing protein n=1 Tax=Ladona fulva TaxID=123851 RepID=A0A8K0PEC6_LADFU|nr:hypothetical protein J437_LFUL019291 [Ladona fulva]
MSSQEWETFCQSKLSKIASALTHRTHPQHKRAAEDMDTTPQDGFITVKPRKKYYVDLSQETAEIPMSTSNRFAAIAPNEEVPEPSSSRSSQSSSDLHTKRKTDGSNGKTAPDRGLSQSGNHDGMSSISLKPPPLQVYGILDIRSFARDLQQVLGTSDFTVQRQGPTAVSESDAAGPSKGDNCRVLLKTKDQHSKTTAFLLKKGISFSTCSDRKDQLHSYLIRGLSIETNPEEILEDLCALDLPAKKVRQLRSRGDQKLPLFVAAIPSTPKWRPSDICSLTCLSYRRVTIRPFKHTDPQMCFKCNRFGHSSAHCYAAPRCWRCAGPHHGVDCRKSLDTPAKCCNCGGEHPAMSRKCPAWQAEKARRASAPTAPHDEPLPRPPQVLKPVPSLGKQNAWVGKSLNLIPSQIRAPQHPRKVLDADFPPLPKQKPVPRESEMLPLQRKQLGPTGPSHTSTIETLPSPVSAVIAAMENMMSRLQAAITTQFQEFALLLHNITLQHGP